MKILKVKTLNVKKGNMATKSTSSTSQVCKKPAMKVADDALSTALSVTPSLDEKIMLLRNSTLTVPEKIKMMQEKLTHPEWNRINGRFATAKKKDEELNETSSVTPKTFQRQLTAAWILDPSKGEVFNQLKCCISATQTMTKTLQWESERSMLKKWSQDELDKHMNSGRIIWREDPSTPGVYEYKDTKNITEVKNVHKQKERQLYQQNALVDETFDEHFQDYEESWNNTGVESYKTLSLRGNDFDGKGSSGKGGPKGKGKGKLALEDDPKKKLKSAKAVLTSTTKTLAAWGFSQKNLTPKVKKTLQQNIKKLEKQGDACNDMQDHSTEDINKFFNDTNALVAECKQVME